MVISILATLGLLLSAYALYVKYSNKPKWCDFSDKASCSKALKSKHSKLFLLPNAAWGILYYATILILPQFTIFITTAGIIVSSYLSYLLYKEKNACIICISTHVINLALFVIALL